jgi:hypothetical protein
MPKKQLPAKPQPQGFVPSRPAPKPSPEAPRAEGRAARAATGTVMRELDNEVLSALTDSYTSRYLTMHVLRRPKDRSKVVHALMRLEARGLVRQDRPSVEGARAIWSRVRA